MLEEYLAMSNNKISLTVESELQETMDRLPRGTKNRFINLCIRQVVFDKNLMSSVYSKLMGIPVNINNLEDNDSFETRTSSSLVEKPLDHILPQSTDAKEEPAKKIVTSKDFTFSVKK
jgi:hypothetical protein